MLNVMESHLYRTLLHYYLPYFLIIIFFVWYLESWINKLHVETLLIYKNQRKTKSGLYQIICLALYCHLAVSYMGCTTHLITTLGARFFRMHSLLHNYLFLIVIKPKKNCTRAVVAPQTSKVTFSIIILYC